MPSKERMLWFFITGLLLGFLYCNFSYKKNSVTLHSKDISEYPLLDIVGSYLKKYYIEPNKLDKKALMYGAAAGLYKATGDEYTTIFPPNIFKEFASDISGNIAGIGVYLQKQPDDVFVLSLVPKSPAIKAGLKVGDRIININEIPIHNFSMEEIAKRIQGEENSWVILDIFRPSTQMYQTIKVKRNIIALPSVYSEILKKKIAYLKINEFNDNTAKEVKTALKSYTADIQSLILDLRNNPGGQLDSSNQIADFFLPKKTPIVSIKSPNREENTTYFTQNEAVLFSLKLPIIVLINGQSASAAEILAAALKDNKRATLVGTKSFGKASIQSIFPIDYENETFGIKITVAHYLTSDGKDINHIGIKPHFQIDLPSISPLEQAKLETIIDSHILENYLGKNLEKPLSKSIIQDIDKNLIDKNMSISPALLHRAIKEQKNIALGNLYTVEWEFDTQLAKAISLLEKSINGK